jgi:hypothetical protein
MSPARAILILQQTLSAKEGMIVQTSRIEELAAAAIGNGALAASWLQQPSALFGGTSPLDAIATPRGRYSVRRQLAWFAGECFRAAPLFESDRDGLAGLLSDPVVDLVLRRAGAGPEELLGHIAPAKAAVVG